MRKSTITIMNSMIIESRNASTQAIEIKKLKSLSFNNKIEYIFNQLSDFDGNIKARALELSQMIANRGEAQSLFLEVSELID